MQLRSAAPKGLKTTILSRRLTNSGVNFRHAAAIPLRALVERNPDIEFKATDDVMMGCGFPDHEQGYNVGRNASLLAGYDHHVPAVTVSRFCASSLQTALCSTRARRRHCAAAAARATSRSAMGRTRRSASRADQC